MTSIEWTDVTWNPVRGCSRVSEGCRNCYAEAMAARFCGPGQPYEGLVRRKLKVISDDDQRTEARWTGEVRFDQATLAKPLHWRKPRRIFVNSMSDLFHEALTDEQIAAVFGVMAATPQHTYQILTKRPRRMLEILGKDSRGAWSEAIARHHLGGENPDMICDQVRFGDRVPPNVWLGVSVENQAAADERIPLLLQTPAAVRFLSCEPLLDGVDLRCVQHNREFEIDALTGHHGVIRPLRGRGPKLDWVIAGCESGPRARPCDVVWLRSLRDQCAQAVVPFFLKQAVEQAVESYTTVDAVVRGDGSTRKRDGLIALPYLDGVQHAAFPTRAQ